MSNLPFYRPTGVTSNIIHILYKITRRVHCYIYIFVMHYWPHEDTILLCCFCLNWSMAVQILITHSHYYCLNIKYLKRVVNDQTNLIMIILIPRSFNSPVYTAVRYRN